MTGRMSATVVSLGLGLGGLAAPPAPAASTAVVVGARPAVRETVVIGHSVRGRPITAYRLGDRAARRTVVALAVMHGSERAPGRTLRTLRDGPRIAGVDLWVVPVVNPDGAARHRRANAHGVDLNRNFPDAWKRAPHRYNAGRRPASEPETRAVMRFLDAVDPDLVVSFHQPLAAVDLSGTKDLRLSRALAKALRLPVEYVDCTGVCHGTLTGWFNATHDGMALTVEFGRRPSAPYLTRTAPRGLLGVISDGPGPAAENPV